MKRIIAIILMLTVFSSLYAATPAEKIKEKKSKRKTEKLRLEDELRSGADTLTNEFLDTVTVKKALVVNDYSLIGVQYGVGLSRVSWNPHQKQKSLFSPTNIGISYTKYGQMFALPLFAFKVGLFYAKEGYEFEYNEEYNYTYTIEGAEKAVIEVVEVPLTFQIHYDTWNFKLYVDIGCYGGYRLGIQRFPGKVGNVSPDLEFEFKDTDIRIDYGLKFGVGLALVFDPLEFHVSAGYKHSFSSLYTPDHNSQYYYRFAYPYNFILSAGVHFQLSKRSGKTKAELKKQAKTMVYGDTGSQGR